MRIARTILFRLLSALMLISLVACDDELLYSDLSEREANEMVAELMMAGIPASKNNNKGNRYGISVEPEMFSAAVHLLKNRGLPRQQYDTLGDVFAKEGFVSSPLEERARLNHALSQEIASTLSSIDGVVLARVHLAVPPKNELYDTVSPASASVFVKHRSGVDLSGSVSQIKALVVNGIENLPYENVTVALFESTSKAALPYVPAVDSSNGSVANAKQMSIFPLSVDGTFAGIIALGGMLLAIVLAVLKYKQSQVIDPKQRQSEQAEA